MIFEIFYLSSALKIQAKYHENRIKGEFPDISQVGKTPRKQKISESALDIFKHHNRLCNLRKMIRQRMIEVALKSLLRG